MLVSNFGHSLSGGLPRCSLTRSEPQTYNDLTVALAAAVGPDLSQQSHISDIEQIESSALRELDAAGGPDQLEQWRIAYLGRRGRLTQVLRSLGGLAPEERGRVGAAANRAKAALEQHLAERERSARKSQIDASLAEQAIDVTLPGWPSPTGGLHPTTRTIREICDAFVSMGFEIMEGPEVEWDRYNFEMLNIPKHHPARDSFDTLWIDYTDSEGERPMLLRAHTSPMQARVMESRRPPVRVVVPGKCYRYEATDPTHEWHFSQVEGLAVDRGITMSDLKGTLHEFVRRVFGPERRVRFRCDYFPFVEPGVDWAIDCFACAGEGCRICGDSGWIEIAGAGMVHPNVLEGVGYDPAVYTGFAFGMGVERVAMLKHGIEDVRLFYANDLRFLRQF